MAAKPTVTARIATEVIPPTRLRRATAIAAAAARRLSARRGQSGRSRVGTGSTCNTIWANAFTAWLLTSLIRRFGGFRLYRALRPAFLGLVFGHYLTDAAMAVFAALVLGSRGVMALQ